MSQPVSPILFAPLHFFFLLFLPINTHYTTRGALTHPRTCVYTSMRTSIPVAGAPVYGIGSSWGPKKDGAVSKTSGRSTRDREDNKRGGGGGGGADVGSVLSR